MDSADIGALVPLAAFVMIVFIAWFGTREKQARIQARTDLHRHLLDKFGSGTELSQFLETEGGRRMVANLENREANPRARALRPMIAGAVLTCLGVAFLLLTVREEDLLIPGGLVLAIGIGFLIGAFVTLRLSKSWDADKEGSGAAVLYSSVRGQRRRGGRHSARRLPPVPPRRASRPRALRSKSVSVQDCQPSLGGSLAARESGATVGLEGLRRHGDDLRQPVGAWPRHIGGLWNPQTSAAVVAVAGLCRRV